MMPLANDMAYDLKRIIDSAVFNEAATAATRPSVFPAASMRYQSFFTSAFFAKIVFI